MEFGLRRNGVAELDGRLGIFGSGPCGSMASSAYMSWILESLAQ